LKWEKKHGSHVGGIHKRSSREICFVNIDHGAGDVITAPYQGGGVGWKLFVLRMPCLPMTQMYRPKLKSLLPFH